MIGILSNINVDSVIKRCKKKTECIDGVGYGNVLETLMNPMAEINNNKVEAVFIMIDLREFLAFHPDSESTDSDLEWREKVGAHMENRICDFFYHLKNCIKPGKNYFLTDGEYYLPESSDYGISNQVWKACMTWNQQLMQLCEEMTNVRIFPYQELVRKIGENQFYSLKTWYLGSIRYSVEGTKAIVNQILELVDKVENPVKKVLALDLDNTLWGGVVGEEGPLGIRLAESGIGKAYKEFQTSIKMMKENGVILVLVSKNNPVDALEAFEKNPYMVLKKEDISLSKINWQLKSCNIEEIARELNVGLNSIVFLDDNPVEREEVKSRLSEVVCPEFPENPEELLPFIIEINNRYFKKLVITKEDREKTKQYQAKARVQELREQAGDFTSFLDSLKIRLKRVEASHHKERLFQLLQKTNQFNTTVNRYSYEEIENMLASTKWQFYFYEVSDRYANHGLCALAVVKLEEGKAMIDNFIMSCRVMGRNIEFGVLEDIEQILQRQGITSLESSYCYGPKNMPVEELYERAEFQLMNSDGKRKNYQLNLMTKKEKQFVGEYIRI